MLRCAVVGGGVGGEDDGALAGQKSCSVESTVVLHEHRTCRLFYTLHIIQLQKIFQPQRLLAICLHQVLKRMQDEVTPERRESQHLIEASWSVTASKQQQEGAFGASTSSRCHPHRAPIHCHHRRRLASHYSSTRGTRASAPPDPTYPVIICTTETED